MKSYGEYCPIAMGSDAIGDRWTPLILRELICGSERFSDIHRGVPRMSRSLLAQRLKQMERVGLIERRPGPTYHLSPSGRELEEVIWALGDWAMRWLLGQPEEDQLDGAHLMWRVRQNVIPENLPDQRTVVQFDFPDARRGRTVWLVLDPAGSTVCERDEGFDVDLYVKQESANSCRSGWDTAPGKMPRPRERWTFTGLANSFEHSPTGSPSAPSPAAIRTE
jgi:DNA-binding HxlR family transcriptional regulator